MERETIPHLQRRRVLLHPHSQDLPTDLDSLESYFWTRKLPFALGGLVRCGWEDEKGKEGEERRRERVGDLERNDAERRRSSISRSAGVG